MAYQALYRQWRPVTFSQVIGQEAVVKTLRHQIETGRIAHAYLFCGCRGTGKTTLAKIMSRAINCEHPHDGDPCGECEPCKSILSETTLDVLELDAASNNSVENVRDLLEQVRYPAQVGKYKVYIIDEVHMLSVAAFNALLKTLEEPPAHVVFILATTEPQKLPATILSRVQRYDFGHIPTGLMIERMELALAKLEIAAEPEALQIVASAAEGAMRDAFSILDMCVSAATDGKLTAATVRDVLGVSDKAFLFGFADSLAAADSEGVLRRIDELMRAGREPQVFLREASQHLRALLTVKAVPEGAAALLDVTDEDERRYREQSAKFTQAQLLRILDGYMRAESGLRYASSPRVGLEVASLQACQQAQGEDTAALLERIGALEGKLTALTTAIDSGGLTAAAKPAKAAPAKENTAPEAKPKAEPKPAPKDEQEVWERTMQLIARTEPPLFGLLKNERFIGAKGSVYQVQVAFARKDFSYLKLGQQSRKDTVAKALTEVAGVPLTFEPVLENDPASSREQARKADAQTQLVDAFGRDLVQVDDTEAHS